MEDVAPNPGALCCRCNCSGGGGSDGRAPTGSARTGTPFANASAFIAPSRCAPSLGAALLLQLMLPLPEGGNRAQRSRSLAATSPRHQRRHSSGTDADAKAGTDTGTDAPAVCAHAVAGAD